MDAAYRETEKIIKALEVRVNREYAQAVKEIHAKIDDYMER